MYLFYADTLGFIPSGSDGMISLKGCNLSRRAIEKLAHNFLGNRAGRVYLMKEWTQAMSELNPLAFEDYIADHGEVVAHS